jgi:hypothetical protein
MILQSSRLRCLSSESAWDGGEIWTETRFEVVERNKGLLGGIVTVRMMGGRAGNFYSRVDGVPVFRAGERCICFSGERLENRTECWVGLRERFVFCGMRAVGLRVFRRSRRPQASIRG